MDFSVHYLAVVVSAVVMMGIGAMWYGPLFGKQWMVLSGHTMGEGGKKAAQRGYLIGAASALVMAFVLAMFIEIAGAVTLQDALTVSFWLWLGFVATVMTGIVAWEGKPWKLYFLNAVYQLVSLVVMASILTLWT